MHFVINICVYICVCVCVCILEELKMMYEETQSCSVLRDTVFTGRKPELNPKSSIS